MKTIINVIDSLYQQSITKKLYVYILSGVTIILLLIIPSFITQRKIFVSFWFDFCIRILITYSFYSMFHFVSHLDQYYSNFYKGVINTLSSTPDKIKQIVNIFASVFAGFAVYLIYHSVLNFFSPSLNKSSEYISLAIGIFVFLPLISQYKKR